MQHIADRREFDAVLQSDRPVLFVFTAAWCKACSSISPILQRLGEEMQDEMVKRGLFVWRVNIYSDNCVRCSRFLNGCASRQQRYATRL